MMLFALADRLGKTVSELSRDLTMEEFAEWMAYCSVSKET